MALDCDAAPINIQEITKNYDNQTVTVRTWLRSNTLLGQVLRVLVRRLKCSYSREPYSSLDLQVLLLVSLAEMEPPDWTKSNAAAQAGRQ